MPFFTLVKQITKKQHLLLVILSAISIGLYWYIPPISGFVNGEIVQRRWLSSGEQNALVGPNTKNWAPFDSTSRHFINAVISAEDSRFFEHNGIDPKEIWESIKVNFSEKSFVRGASTITQQVIKLGVLSSEKTLIRKSRELIGAIIMESVMTKNEILAWYCNLADFGSGIYGIKAASRYYFATTPETLTLVESIHLALVLPAPNTWSKSLKQKLLTDFGRKRFKIVLGELRNSSHITEHEYELAMLTGNFGRPVSSIVNKTNGNPKVHE